MWGLCGCWLSPPLLLLLPPPHPPPHPNRLSPLSPLGITDAAVPLATATTVTLKCYYQTAQMGPGVSSSLHGGEGRKVPLRSLQHSSHSVKPTTTSSSSSTLRPPSHHTPSSVHRLGNEHVLMRKAVCFQWAVWSWNQEWASINSII